MTAPAHTFGYSQLGDWEDDAELLDVGVGGAILGAEVIGGASLTAPSLGKDVQAYPSASLFPSASLYPGAGLYPTGTAPVNVVGLADLADPGVFDAILQT